MIRLIRVCRTLYGKSLGTCSFFGGLWNKAKHALCLTANLRQHWCTSALTVSFKLFCFFYDKRSLTLSPNLTSHPQHRLLHPTCPGRENHFAQTPPTATPSHSLPPPTLPTCTQITSPPLSPGPTAGWTVLCTNCSQELCLDFSRISLQVHTYYVHVWPRVRPRIVWVVAIS